MSFSGVVTVGAGITVTNDNTNTITMSNAATVMNTKELQVFLDNEITSFKKADWIGSLPFQCMIIDTGDDLEDVDSGHPSPPPTFDSNVATRPGGRRLCAKSVRNVPQGAGA